MAKIELHFECRLQICDRYENDPSGVKGKTVEEAKRVEMSLIARDILGKHTEEYKKNLVVPGWCVHVAASNPGGFLDEVV